MPDPTRRVAAPRTHDGTTNAAYNGIELPRHMERLPRDAANRPVPAFVEWIDGVPDFRIMSVTHLARAVKLGVCWTCGEPLGAHKTFVIGPMCAVNRVSAEPPSHTDCARFSAIACPFLSNPNKVRREAHKPEGAIVPAGELISRNPGVTLLWTVRRYRLERDGQGVLFRIGEPEAVEWYREGREATRAEIMESIDSGAPILRGMAEEEGPRAVAQYERMYERAMSLVPA